MNADSIFNKISDILKEHEKPLENVKLKYNKDYQMIFIEDTAAFRITLNSKSKYISTKVRYEHLFRQPLKLSSIDSDSEWIRYSITTEYDLDEISNVILYIYDDCKPSGPMFGCCSRFNACSDEKKCVHPDKVYAKNCWYQENLKQGKIFYGVNRNI